MSARGETIGRDGERTHDQRPIPIAALQAGLDVLGRAMAREHPGLRFVFGPGPGDGCAGLVGGGEVAGSLTAPENADSTVIERYGLGAARAASAAHEDGVDHGTEDLGPLAA